jgi:hypothetical protein
MMRHQRFSIASLLLLLLTLPCGCAHYYWPGNQLESPEAIGPAIDGGKVAHLEILSIQSGTDLVAQPEKQATDPKTGVAPDPVLSTSFPEYAFSAAIAVHPRLDVGVRIAPFAPVQLKAKYQLSGEPESKARAGDWSAALAGYGGLLLGTYNSAGVTFYTGGASVIGGFRFAQSHLAILSPYLSFAGLSGVGDASGSGLRYGASVGYQYDAESLLLKLELTWASGSFTQQAGSTQAGGFFPGATLGLKL